MSDDIVTRLRKQACPECKLPSTHNQFDEAADEIERLRAELQRWKTCEMVTVSICGWDIDETYCGTCKTVRGE